MCSSRVATIIIAITNINTIINAIIISTIAIGIERQGHAMIAAKMSNSHFNLCGKVLWFRIQSSFWQIQTIDCLWQSQLPAQLRFRIFSTLSDSPSVLVGEPDPGCSLLLCKVLYFLSVFNRPRPETPIGGKWSASKCWSSLFCGNAFFLFDF